MTCVNHKINLTLVFQFAFSLVSFVLHITFIPVFLFNNQALKMKRVLLPLELIIEILLRLPVKSLVRFKCVCKSWLSLISDPHFATSHFELAAALRERVLFLELSDAPVIRSIDLNASLHDDSASATLNLNFLHPEPSICQIIGSCRGFVVLDCQSLWVWNPSTCVHKQVPCSPISSDVNGLFFTFVYGFGYDSSTDDYLIVQMSYNPHSDYRTRVEVFSLRADLWKEIEGIHLSYINCCDDIKVGSLLNDAIHWPVFNASQDVSMDVIVAFDLMERTFSEIPLPVDFGCEFYFCDLKVLGEFLSLCIGGYYDPAEIWVMKEYKVQSSWTKTVVVSVDYIPSKRFSLICSTKCGDIVGSDEIAGLVKCNDEGQLQEHRSYTKGSTGDCVSVYVESLLSLPGADEQVQVE